MSRTNRGFHDRARGLQNRPPQWEQQLNDCGATKEAVAAAVHQGGRPLVELAKELGNLVKEKGLTTSQIRNAYGLVKQMEMVGFKEHEFVLLKPKLAYAAARAERDGAHQLSTVLTWGIDAVGSDPDHFQRFVDLFEAILAYHKAAGGK